MSPAGDIVTLAFGREAADFSEDERDLLNLLRPHLEQAYRNADAMTTFQSQLECREESLQEAVAMAVVVVDGGKIRHASRLAIRWLSSFFGDGIAPNDELPDRLRRWVRFWQTSLDGKQSDLKHVHAVDRGISRRPPQHPDAQDEPGRRSDSVAESRGHSRSSRNCCNGSVWRRAKRKFCSGSRRARPAARLRRSCRSRAKPSTSTSSASIENSAPKPAPPPPRLPGPRCATPDAPYRTREEQSRDEMACGI